MGKFNLNLPDPNIDEIILNDLGDSMLVSSDDANFLKKFTNGYAEIIKISDEVPEEFDKIGELDIKEDDYHVVSKKIDDIATTSVNLSEKACSIIDGIFGEGTARKSFHKYYDANPDFCPNAKLIIAFFETMVTIIEKIYSVNLKQQKESMAAMAKYVPQDHRKPVKNPYERAEAAVSNASESNSW